MGQFGKVIVGRKDQFFRGKVREGSGEFVCTAINRVPKSSDRAEPFLRIEFGLPVLPRRLFLERGEKLKSVCGRWLRSRRLGCSKEPNSEKANKDCEKQKRPEPRLCFSCGAWILAHGKSVYVNFKL